MSISEESKQPSFKHLSVLRKALSQAHTGEIVYKTRDEKLGQLTVTIGDLINDEETTMALEQLLTESIENCELISERVDEKMKDLIPPAAMIKVLNDIKWKPKTLEALKATFSKLPPINVKMMPLHRYGYSDGLTYLMLYQEHLKDKSFTTVKFFNNRPAFTTLEQQIKVLVLGYCLGLINPKVAAKAQPALLENSEGARRVSFANRILDKIRGL